jgi:hypothetical protein
MVELERVDIITEASMLASQLACPRDGHLEAVCRICCACLSNKHNSRMVFDLTCAKINMILFKRSATGASSVVAQKSPCRPTTCPNLVVKKSKFICMLILTMMLAIN